MPAGTAREETKIVRAKAERLADIRSWMLAENLDGLLVPMADEFQSEWVPEQAKRLRWLTGFQGSFALTLVSRNSAIVYLPAMYELQGREQINTEEFSIEVINGAQFDLTDFVKQLGAGAKIACDGRLVTSHQANEFIAQLEKISAEMIWLHHSPVDKFWTDRPKPQDQPLFVYPEQQAGESSVSKRQRIGKLVDEAGADCTVLTLSDSICWLLNVRGYDGPISPLSLSYIVLHADGSVDWFVETGNLTQAVRTHVGKDTAIFPLADFWNFLKGLGQSTVLIEDASIPFAARKSLELAGARIVQGADPCQRPKSSKNAVEVERMRKAHVRDGAALSRYLCWLETELRSGATLTELEGASRLTAFRAEDPEFHAVSFPTISAAGEHAALPHYVVDESTNAPIRADRCYLVDSGGHYRDGGTTDVTRTIWLNNPPARFCEEYTRVLKGYLAIDVQRFRCGSNGAALDPLARQYLWQAGKDYPHGTGHGVGAFLHVHEGPQRISSACPAVPLEPGNILSNEPGYYRAGEYGIRIENLLVVEPRPIEGDEIPMLGMKVLTLTPIDTRPMVREMLTDAEVDYLNQYHQRVLTETSPLVDHATRSWLEARCAPI